MAEKFFGGGDILLVEQKKNLRGAKGEKMLGVAGEGARGGKENKGGKGNKGGMGGKSLRELRGKKMEEEKNITMTGQSNQRKTMGR